MLALIKKIPFLEKHHPSLSTNGEKFPEGRVGVLALAKTPARVIDADHLIAAWGDDAALTEGQRQMKAESSSRID